MEILLNGERRQVPEGATIALLVQELGLGRFSVAVERNQQVVPKDTHETTVLAAGDRIEVVTLVGGG